MPNVLSQPVSPDHPVPPRTISALREEHSSVGAGGRDEPFRPVGLIKAWEFVSVLALVYGITILLALLA